MESWIIIKIPGLTGIPLPMVKIRKLTKYICYKQNMSSLDCPDEMLEFHPLQRACVVLSLMNIFILSIFLLGDCFLWPSLLFSGLPISLSIYWVLNMCNEICCMQKIKNWARHSAYCAQEHYSWLERTRQSRRGDFIVLAGIREGVRWERVFETGLEGRAGFWEAKKAKRGL